MKKTIIIIVTIVVLIVAFLMYRKLPIFSSQSQSAQVGGISVSLDGGTLANTNLPDLTQYSHKETLGPGRERTFVFNQNTVGIIVACAAGGGGGGGGRGWEDGGNTAYAGGGGGQGGDAGKCNYTSKRKFRAGDSLVMNIGYGGNGGKGGVISQMWPEDIQHTFADTSAENGQVGGGTDVTLNNTYLLLNLQGGAGGLRGSNAYVQPGAGGGVQTNSPSWRNGQNGTMTTGGNGGHGVANGELAGGVGGQGGVANVDDGDDMHVESFATNGSDGQLRYGGGGGGGGPALWYDTYIDPEDGVIDFFDIAFGAWVASNTVPGLLVPPGSPESLTYFLVSMGLVESGVLSEEVQVSVTNFFAGLFDGIFGNHSDNTITNFGGNGGKGGDGFVTVYWQ